jgi:predicted Zn-dependent protease with MMP-like domain
MSVPDSGWPNAKAPSLDEFESIAGTAFSGLPEHFRKFCGGVLIRVADFPDDEVAADMEIESPFELLGLFTGVGMAEDGAVPETGRMPNSIFLYRRPLLDYWAEHDETLGAIISHVQVHEIGHHFGLSDADMEAIDAAADEARS